MKKNREEWATNRDIAKTPRKSQGWCYGCDMALVTPGAKCKVCGVREVKERNKKSKGGN